MVTRASARRVSRSTSRTLRSAAALLLRLSGGGGGGGGGGRGPALADFERFAVWVRFRDSGPLQGRAGRREAHERALARQLEAHRLDVGLRAAREADGLDELQDVDLERVGRHRDAAAT